MAPGLSRADDLIQEDQFIAGQWNTRWEIKCCCRHKIHTIPQLSTKVATTVPVGPFEIIRKMSRAAYELRLPDAWFRIHPEVFHISQSEALVESLHGSSPVDLQPEDIRTTKHDQYIQWRGPLRWRRVQIGRKKVQGVF